MLLNGTGGYGQVLELTTTVTDGQLNFSVSETNAATDLQIGALFITSFWMSSSKQIVNNQNSGEFVIFQTTFTSSGYFSINR